jgi:tetratricopeptide (TPR) repeat protein
LGYCLFREKRYEEAIASYDRAVSIDPKLAEAHAGLGVVRMGLYLRDNACLDCRRLAVEHWHRSLELNPNQPKLRKLIDKYRMDVPEPTSVLLGQQ